MKMKQLILPILGFGSLAASVLAIANAKRHLAIVGGVALLAAQTNAQTLINGAGSSFDYPAFTKWFETYGKQNPDVRFNYQSIGSGAGQKQLLNQTVDFGASDAPMTDEAMSMHRVKSCTCPWSLAASPLFTISRVIRN